MTKEKLEDSQKDEIKQNEYLKKLFNSIQYISLIKKIYDNTEINLAKENSIKLSYF